MKNFTVRADTRVRIDINEILGFLESRQVNLSHKFLKDYLKALKKLEKNPYFQIRYKDIRCLPLENLNT